MMYRVVMSFLCLVAGPPGLVRWADLRSDGSYMAETTTVRGGRYSTTTTSVPTVISSERSVA